MGEVYRARDTRLDRDVAIKVLPTPFAAERDRLRRFEEEARAIAALNHPHICQIYDIGPGYLVLEYVDGAPPRGPLTPTEAVRLGLQIASALEAAHRRGILHRDLKPDNILVTPGGTVKLLDFGLAKAITRDHDETRTREGTVLGTPAYMSPEQAQGRPLDERSDIFSFGAVLYELLAGSSAFLGRSTADVISAVLRDEPQPLLAPVPIARVVRRCLAKDPSQRFQTMSDVAAALREAVVTHADQQPSIAVLPFVNMSRDPDDEYFSDGLAEELINLLTHVPGLKVTARASAFAFRGADQDIRRIAEALSVRTVLQGGVRRAGQRIRVTAQLINAADGYNLWSERYDRELTDVFAIQDDIAEAIAAALRVRLGARPTQHTPGFPAYEALLRGRHQSQRFTAEALERARQSFIEAAALDPAYAEPHAELGLSLLFLVANTVMTVSAAAPLIRAAAWRALEIDPSESGPHFLLGTLASVHDYDWKAATDEFSKAMSGSAVSANARWAYATFYLGALGRYEESAAEMRRAVEQDPLNVTWRANLGLHLHFSGLHDRALDEVRDALELDDRHWGANFIAGETHMATGDFPAAVAAAERAYQINPVHSMAWGLLAAALVKQGQADRAATLIREHGASPKPVFGRVLYHLHCSEIDAAADWWETMIGERELFAIEFASAPVVRPLRESPRWPQLARLMNLPELPGR
jgi:serine/threonine-protein kinase